MAINASRQQTAANSFGELNPGLRARKALDEGDFKLARTIAVQVLKDPQTSEAAKAEAKVIIDATKVDKAPLIAGFVMLAVLSFLFFFVMNQQPPA